ncbi:MAG: Fic family protein [Patescibacteria group bacterium]
MSNKKIELLLDSILKKKNELDSYQPINPTITKNMGDWLKNELTFTSNAIEGNTLTRQETRLVVEDDLSIGGKRVRELLEAKNHDKAISYTLSLASQKKTNDLEETDLLEIHSTILRGIDDFNAGKYRNVPVRISGSFVIPPNFFKVPILMQELFEFIVTDQALHSIPILSLIQKAVEVHFRLVNIHPFVDGNGRTARLLFNLILLQAGLPLVFVSKEERSTYLSSLEKAQTGGANEDYQYLMLKAIERSLDLYLEQVTNKQSNSNIPLKLLKIGELGKLAGEDVATIRYWTKLELLKVYSTTKSGYALYDESQVVVIKNIRNLQSQQRMALDEIKKILN